MGLFSKKKKENPAPVAPAPKPAAPAAPVAAPPSGDQLTAVYQQYFTGLPFTEDSSPAYAALLAAAAAEANANRAIAIPATECDDATLDRLAAKATPEDAAQQLAVAFKTGEFGLIIEDNVYSVDFIDRVPHCVALATLLLAQKLPAGNRQLVIELEPGTPLGAFGDALNQIQQCDASLHFSITEAAD
ncbi:MAG: hypothetical protein IJ168_00875 [Eubacterium sp.]|nr:hypothetical protein [Eubacterium sp.]